LARPRVRNTRHTYLARGRVHTEVAELLDRAINDGFRALRPKKFRSEVPLFRVG